MYFVGKSRRVFQYPSGPWVGGWGTELPIKGVQMGFLVMLRISGCVSLNYS